MTNARKPYLSDDEWSLVVSYLILVREDAPQQQHSLRELFNALRYVVRYGIAGAPCRTTCRHGRRSTSRPSAVVVQLGQVQPARGGRRVIMDHGREAGV